MTGPRGVVDAGFEREDGRVSPEGDLSEPDPVELAVQAAPGGVALGPRTPPLLPLHGAHTDRVGVDSARDRPELSTAQAAARPGGIARDLRDAGPVAVASFAANGANIVVTLVLARLLTTRGYGALAQLTALFLIVSMPGTALAVGVVRRVTALSTSGAAGSVGTWARRVHLRGMCLVVAFSIVVFCAREPLAKLLSIPAPLGVFAILAAGGVWVLLSLDRGLLQSHREYRTLSANLLATADGAFTLVTN